MKPFWKVVFGGCLGTLIAFILFNLFVFGLIGSAVSSLSTKSEKQPVVPRNAILKIDLSQPIAERDQESFSFNLLAGSADMSNSVSILQAIQALDIAAGDPQVRFVYLKADALNMDIALAEEFRSALLKFRECGKPIIAYSQSFSGATYYLSSVADKVILNAYGDCSIQGLNSQLMYYKDLIDYLGVDVQLIRHGKYKSAGEPYIKSEMSQENKEQYEKLLGSIWSVMSESISASRDFTADQFNEWIDNLAIEDGKAAKELGLVDELWYDDQVRDYFCTLCDVKKPKDLKYVSLRDYALAKVRPNVRAKAKIAVIYADGQIVMDDEGNGYIGNNFAKEIAAVRQDSSVKAVVFRVNSPGGSVQASAAIEREIELLKACKPVVASYGGYAASGGYWISCGSDKIFSDKTTLTGSIGVFGLIPSFGRALKKNVHLNVFEVSTHKHGALASGMFPLDPEEEKVMQHTIDMTYDDFVGRVAAGRGMTAEAVDAIAQGRVWAGVDALGIGLVDEMGGLTDAIRYAASMASLEQYRLVEYPAVVSMYEQMLSSLSEEGTDQDIQAGVLPMAQRLGGWLLGLQGPEVVARMDNIDIVWR